MFKKFAAALAFGLPVAALASEAVVMTCESSVKSFFAPLVQRHLIDTKPFTVDGNSVNYFRPKLFAGISAYGMPVTGILGYTDDPLLFVTKGTSPGDGYGVIVKETIANVQAQLSSVGAVKARTIRFDAHSTIIFCKGVTE